MTITNALLLLNIIYAWEGYVTYSTYVICACIGHACRICIYTLVSLYDRSHGRYKIVSYYALIMEVKICKVCIKIVIKFSLNCM